MNEVAQTVCRQQGWGQRRQDAERPFIANTALQSAARLAWIKGDSIMSLIFFGTHVLR